jgi:hypothetical protein
MALSDIFREVEEEVRRERFEQIWKQYGDYIIAGVALIVIAIAGFELWQRYEENQKLKASETFIAAQQLAISGNFNQASAAFTVVAREAPDGYAKMARLSQAGVLEISGQRSDRRCGPVARRLDSCGRRAARRHGLAPRAVDRSN